jgi:methyl-accepting chemotaxis protein
MKKRSISTKVNTAIITISVISLVAISAILFYLQNNTKTEVHKNVQQELVTAANAELKAKGSIGLTNALSIVNDGRIKKSLKLNDRKWAILSLSTIAKQMKQYTKFKNIKAHLHTKDNHSFVREWKLKKYGDDLSSFRSSVVAVNSTKNPVVTFEVGSAGLSLRSVVPVFDDDGSHLGSLEFMQGLNSVAKTFKKANGAFLLLMDENLKRKPIPANKQFKNYGISQNFIDQDFLADAKKIDLNELFKNKYLLGDKYFYTYVDIKDFQGKKLGIALLGKPLSIVDEVIDSEQQIITIALTLIALMALIIVLFMIVSIKKIVVNPLVNFNNAITKLIQSNSNRGMRVEKVSNDEIGQIADNFNQYLQKIDDGLDEDQKVIDAVKASVETAKTGLMTKKIEISTSNESLNELKDGFNDLLTIVSSKVCGNLNKISDALEHFKNSNFTHRISGNLGEVSHGLNTLADIINEMLVENKRNGLTLDNSSDILLKNVSKLNENSNQAAAALEQTAAALEEITTNISNNTNNIVKMAGYASSLTKSSNEGKKLASQTTTAMTEIDDEVNAISEAISVIDQISFQTNILSLNAAVEAATAGEAGKGFAVVAQEVRNLASRSADAANDIKKLVDNATTKANNGKTISDKMIEGYTGLNENITKTIDLISNVEHASKEQLSGIEQINNAVAELDRQTQQNAAIASQTNDVAVQTDTIAKLVVANANTKEFIGKDSVTAKDMGNNSSKTVNKKQDISNDKPTVKSTTRSTPKTISKPSSLSKIKSNATDDNQWASF